MKTFAIILLLLILGLSCSGKQLQSAVAIPITSDPEEAAMHIDSLLTSYAWYGRLSGTILIMHKDQVLYHNSFGWADKENQRPNSNTSVYGVGSFTKSFTSTAIMKLVQERKISTDDNLYSFFPGLGETARDITIHHLLSMSSGIYEDFSRSKTYDIENVVFPQPDPITTHQLVHYFGELTSDKSPGKKFDYSNINYIFLAAIVEQVSGLDYGTFLKENFFDPFSMHSSVFGMENVAPGLLAHPYTGLPNSHDAPDDWHDSWVKGAGGNFASAEDIYRWMNAVNQRRVLDSVHTEKLFFSHTKSGNESYGYGWEIGKRKGNTYVYHEGGTPGYVCEAGFYPELDLYVVVLTNHTHHLMEVGKTVLLNHRINREIQNILFDQPCNKLPLPQIFGKPDLEGNVTIGGFEYTLFKDDKNIRILAGENSPSFMDIAFEQNLKEDSRRFKKAQKLAEAFGNEDFKYIHSRGRLAMRMLLSAKTLRQMWGELTGDKGEFISYDFYTIPNERFPNHYRMRLTHANKQIGLLLILDKRGRIDGMHIDQRFTFNGPKEVSATIINDSLIFVDGFRFGNEDAMLVKMNGKWHLEMLGREFEIDQKRKAQTFE
jgi:CubicO group peptidase (beta-lactamase class C family)